MITLLITLFVIVIIQFSFFLILEYSNYKHTNKLNDNDKTISNHCNSIRNDNDICEDSNKTK